MTYFSSDRTLEAESILMGDQPVHLDASTYVTAQHYLIISRIITKITRADNIVNLLLYKDRKFVTFHEQLYAYILVGVQIIIKICNVQ